MCPGVTGSRSGPVGLRGSPGLRGPRYADGPARPGVDAGLQRPTGAAGPAPALAAAVDPADPADPWPGEQVALGAESALEALLPRWLPVWIQPLFSPSSHGTSVSWSVTRKPVAPRRSSGFGTRQPSFRCGDPIARVHVVSTERPVEGTEGPGGLARTASWRLGLAPHALGEGLAAQVDLDTTIHWRIKKRLRIQRVIVHRHDQRTAMPRSGTSLQPCCGKLLEEGAIDAVLGWEHSKRPAVPIASRASTRSSSACMVSQWGTSTATMTTTWSWAGRVDKPTFSSSTRAAGCSSRGWPEGFAGWRAKRHAHRRPRRRRRPDIAFARGSDVCRLERRGRLLLLDRVPGTAGLRRSVALFTVRGGRGRRWGSGPYDTRYFRGGGYGAQAPTPYDDAVNGAQNVFKETARE